VAATARVRLDAAQRTPLFSATRCQLDAGREAAQPDASSKGKRGAIMAKGKSTQRKEIKKPKKATAKHPATGRTTT